MDDMETGGDPLTPPRWQVNPHNGEPKDYYRFGVDSRAYLRAWIDHALSPANREYRLERLAAAVGLTTSYVTAYLDGKASIGWGLQEVMNDWASEHVDVSLNAPTDDTTMFAHLGDLG